MPSKLKQGVDYMERLIVEQETAILSGKFERIEQYQSACEAVRMYRRTKEKLKELLGEQDDD